jgi:hypothetical protein
MKGRANRPAHFDPPVRAELYMRQLAFTVSGLISLLRSAAGALLTFLGPSWDGPRRKYRPHDHYMRGPGPKWREKHSSGRVSAGGT